MEGTPYVGLLYSLFETKWVCNPALQMPSFVTSFGEDQ
jgi:hypothetical protein